MNTPDDPPSTLSEGQSAEADWRMHYHQLREELAELKQAIIHYKHEAHYWKAQFDQLKKIQLKQANEIVNLKAALKKREHQLFGKRSEKTKSKSEQTKGNSSGKKRGGQLGSQGHGRRDHSDLTHEEEHHDLSEEDKHCPSCGSPYNPLNETEDSHILEINVKAHVRVIKRHCYARSCRCKTTAGIISTPPAPRVYPKSQYGVSLWSYLLLNKYWQQRSMNEILTSLSSRGLSLAAGTVCDGSKKLLPLMSPLYDAIVEKSLSADHWHADETGWKVFEPIEGKANHRWYLWIFKNTETIVHKLCPSRSSAVLIDHFGQDHEGGILNVDRYSAYKTIAKAGLFILAFCWAHVRRDFLNHAKGYPEQETWALQWIELIATLYHINNQRIQYKASCKRFRQLNKKLVDHVDEMRAILDEQLHSAALLPSAKKLIKSLDKHWEGLIVFVEQPDIPMDNNLAENGLRSSVLGRVRYYGSGSIESAKFTCAMFTIFKTLDCWNINLNVWLEEYLNACANNQSQPPQNLTAFLPWHMTEHELVRFTKPPP